MALTDNSTVRKIVSPNSIYGKTVNTAYGLGTSALKGAASGLIPGKNVAASSLGEMASKFVADVQKGRNTKGGILGASTSREESSIPGVGGRTMWSQPDGPEKPTMGGSKDIAGAGGGASGDADRSEKNRSAKIKASLTAGWDDTGDLLRSAGSALDNSKKYISRLGAVRDQYLRSSKNYLDKTREQIAGNRQVIERNQKDELDNLAEDTRKSMDNTNIMLGIKGATGGSAARAASRALVQSAGKQRAGILRARGDEFSGQNQAEANALEEYNTRRAQAYDWEKKMNEQAVLDFKTDQENLSRLKSRQKGWKAADIKAESDRNLNKFLTTIAEIQARAKTFRDNLAARMTEFGGNADALDNAAIAVDAPAELQTPNFNENIDFTQQQEGEDFFDPNKQGKRVIVGTDAFGNPIYKDELAQEMAA